MAVRRAGTLTGSQSESGTVRRFVVMSRIMLAETSCSGVRLRVVRLQDTAPSTAASRLHTRRSATYAPFRNPTRRSCSLERESAPQGGVNTGEVDALVGRESVGEIEAAGVTCQFHRCP